MKKIGVFVDVQNIYYTVKQQYNSHFNFKYFLKKVSYKNKLILANAYATHKNDVAQKRFQGLLASFGYNVKLTDYIQRSDGSSKGDWDVGISLDIVQNSSFLDQIILASGDGDFESLIRYIKESSFVKVHLYGVPELTSHKLIASADEYSPIDSEYLLAIPEQKW
ncbi:LabA-like NYN domain-containing protein [Candidatus Protochlamydia sp. W-9]|uniref:LabA-like NYN domain-containing protein n=1 Tax=Candidatus Protochlamydia sp. W-9 TaxID=1785087 RepID=UPI00096A9E15|nr:NYN domain-containing protein [Candidatus Protochlamydia sp. W-9]